ncbi:MAG TPA: cytochrome c maturation protein CcmE [Bacteroidota bacterium]|mgnify:FL=1|nr:cytochrome c maturation protein CcmE [Bacteroidota bacterium]
MKPKYIIIGVIVIVFLLLAVFSFSSNKIDYSDFQTAKQTGKTVQVIGKVEDAKQAAYNPSQNLLVFTLIDEKNNSETVYYSGPKPNNFDIAPMVVIKGKYRDGKFVASEILTKCPSKYESKFEEKTGKKI